MATIEGRYRLCKDCSYRVSIGKCDGKCKEYWKVQGATEQQKIDEEEQGKALLYAVHKTAERTKKEVIAKACEWLERYMEQLGYIDEWCRKEDEFIKVMEE